MAAAPVRKERTRVHEKLFQKNNEKHIVYGYVPVSMASIKQFYMQLYNSRSVPFMLYASNSSAGS